MFSRFSNVNNHDVCTSDYVSRAMQGLDFISNSISTRKPWKLQDYFQHFMMRLCLYCILCRRSWDTTVCNFSQIQHGQPRVMWKSCTWFISFYSICSYDPELLTCSAAQIRGSRTQTSRQTVNLPDESHGDCIEYWLGEFETHLFTRCTRVKAKQNVWGRKQIAEWGIK
jgi:hypothetical protein